MTSYKAAGNTQPIMEYDLSRGSLSLRGFVFDRISAVHNASHFQTESDRLYKWHHWAMYPHEREWVDAPQARSTTNPQREETFWRTLIADADTKGNRHPRYLCSQFKAWYQKIVEGHGDSGNFDSLGSKHEEHKDFIVRMRQVVTDRSLFETEKGFIGIGDKDVSAEKGGPQLKAGDLVVVLYGGPLPVLIRRNASTEETYNLIGDAFCYVHGIADGEAMSMPQSKEERVFVLA